MADPVSPRPMGVAMENGGTAGACGRSIQADWAPLRESPGDSPAVRLSQLAEISLECIASSEGTDGKGVADASHCASGGKPLLEKSHEPVTTLQWALMTSVMFIYALINTGMALYVLPVEARRMHPGSGGSVWVSVCIAVCGAAQLVNPIAGKLSDRHASPLGKRRPYIIMGTGLAMMFLVGIWLASYNQWPNVFIGCLLVAEIGLNVAFSAQCGVPADLQAQASSNPLASGVSSKEQEEARGVSSGVVALHSVLGSLCAMFLMVSTQHMAVQVQYPLYILGLAICCLVVCIYAREQPSHTGPKAKAPTWNELKRGFTIDTGRDVDFLWVCLGRMAYYVVTSVLVFQLYYLEDMIHMYDDEERNFKLGIMVVSAQAIGLVSAVPFGRLSNGIGRKVIIYAACIVMSLAAVLQILAPKVGAEGSWHLVWLSAALAGIGNSAYLSVDYALALDCMPQGKTAAEAFGLWGIAGFADSTIGPLFGGLVLHWTSEKADSGALGDGAEEQVHYTFKGYALLFLVLGIGGNALVAYCTSKIISAK